jgi:hypothetical protein
LRPPDPDSNPSKIYSKPKWPPEGFLKDGDVNPGVATADDPDFSNGKPPTWRDIYRIFTLLFNSRRLRRIKNYQQRIQKSQLWGFEHGDDEMSVAMLKAILLEKTDFSLQDKLGESMRRVHIPFILEQLAKLFMTDTYDRGVPFLVALSKFGVRASAKECFELEFARYYYFLTPDNVMNQPTFNYFCSLSLRDILETLLAPVDTRFHISASVSDLECLVLQIAEGKHSEFSHDRLIRAICILWLYYSDKIEDVLRCLLEVDETPLLMIFSKVVHAVLTSEHCKARGLTLLESVLANPTALPRTRFRVACVLLEEGIKILESQISEIPGYPMPWTLDLPLPLQMRKAILKRYATTMSQGTDPRLVIEAHFAKDVVLEDDEGWNPRSSTQPVLDIANLVAVGPVSAGNWHAQGAGCFNVYRIFCARLDAEQVHNRPSIVACYVSTLGPYYYTERHLIDQMSKRPPNMPPDLPSADEAEAAFHTWASSTGLVHVSHLLDMVFPGLVTYFFGNRRPLSIQNLLFYWQD